MRYATVQHDGTLTGARVEGERLVLLDAADAVTAWAAGRRSPAVGEVDVSSARFAPPSLHPRHVLCVGWNYRSHADQLGRALPRYPAFFAKFASTLTGARDTIELPAVSAHVQGEAELAVVVGRVVHRADRAEAARAVAGYAVANDVSMRDWQHRTGEALQGKVADRTTPLGPYLVTPDEVDDARDLRISMTVDGIAWQSGTTADMHVPPHDLVAYCSQFLTLLPGDVLLSGTPGVTPDAGDLRPGTVLRTTVEGLGSAVNPLRAEPRGPGPAVSPAALCTRLPGGPGPAFPGPSAH